MSGYQPAESSDTGFGAHGGEPGPTKRRTSPWIKFGLPLAALIIIGAVLGGVLGTQLNKKSNASTASDPSGSPLSPAQSKSAAASASSAAKAFGRFATGTDTYGLPIYPATTNSALFGSPTAGVAAAAAWPTETFKPSNPQPTSVRPDRPRLIAPSYKWNARTSAYANLQSYDNSQHHGL